MPNGGAPTTTAVPRAARLSTDWRSTCTLPVVSMTPSQPAPPVISAIRAGKSSVRRVDHVGGAELAGEVEPVGDDVDRDDPQGRGEGRGHHGGQTDRAGTGHHDGAAGGRLEHVPHRADAGLHAAAERGDRLQRARRGRP